jgi:hypothetical protein
MKWVLIENRHININNVDMFSWDDGILFVWYNSDPTPSEILDPDHEYYTKMCRSQGIRPYWEA